MIPRRAMLAAAGLAMAPSRAALAQNYPARPVRLVRGRMVSLYLRTPRSPDSRSRSSGRAWRVGGR
jgi:hypothetical protein